MARKKSSSVHPAIDWLAQGSLSLLQTGLVFTAAVIPLFMVPHYTTEPFESNKAALLRTLAPFLLSVWMIALTRLGWLHALELSMPLALAVAGYVLCSLLATLLSIAPRISFWGSHVRSFGTVTTLATVTFFLLAASCGLRQGSAQVRLFRAVLLVSLPVSLYALLQVLRIDPLAGAVRGHPVVSFLGNPNFLAAYLIMVIPLTCSALAMELSSDSREARARMVSLASLLLLQGVALWFSRGRGAMLGLLVGLTMFVLIMAILTRRRRIVLAVAGVLGVGGITLLLLTLPLGSWLRYEFGSRTEYQRLLIWRSAERLALASPARLLIGYGPETLYMALNPYYPPEELTIQVLAGGTLWDRAHNSLLDTAASTGLLGVAAFLWVTGTVLLEGLSRLGIVPTRREAWVALGGGGLVGAFGLPQLLGSWSAAPLGLAFGLVFGLFLVVIRKGIQPLPTSDEFPEVGRQQLLLVGLLAALVAHFIDVQFSFELVSTHLMFWIYGGMISAIARGVECPPLEVRERARQRTPNEIAERRPWTQRSWVSASLLYEAMLVGTVLATMAFSLGLQDLDLRKSWRAVAVLLGSVWIVGSLMATQWGTGSRAEGPRFLKGFPVVLLGSLAWGLAFLPGHLWVLRTEPLPVHFVVPFALYLLVTAVLMAGLIPASLPAGSPAWRRLSLLWLAPLLLTLGIWTAYRIGIVPIVAETYARAGIVGMQESRVDASIALLQRAVALRPERDRYLTLLADAYLQKAKTLFPPDHWLRESESLFLKAAQMTPADPDHLYNLGTLHLRWADLVQPWGDWRGHLDTSIKYYLEAEKLGSPHHRKLVREQLTQVFTRLGFSPDQVAREVARRLPPAVNR